MKSIKSLLLLLPLTLTACNEKKLYYSKPKDTNLDFWITEAVSHDQFSQDEFAVMNGFGVSKYYDRRYTNISEGTEFVSENPEVYLSYEVSGYPDVADSSHIVGIGIAHPDINVFGLTINSSEKEIDEVMKPKADEISIANPLGDGVEFYLGYTIGNVTFTFTNRSITMKVPQTNNKGIVF